MEGRILLHDFIMWIQYHVFVEECICREDVDGLVSWNVSFRLNEDPSWRLDYLIIVHFAISTNERGGSCIVVDVCKVKSKRDKVKNKWHVN